MTLKQYAGPSFTPHWLYKLGFDWEEEFQLEDGWTRTTHQIPTWAQTPHANIIGTWNLTRRRRTWLGIVPIGTWHTRGTYSENSER